LNILPQWIVRVGRDLLRSLAGEPSPVPVVPLTQAPSEHVARGGRP
jgi:hypothetical protein